ncbi:MAG: molybdenum cofactor biosynthesis protein MoaE [Ktedonobacterales bacterium]
MTDSTQAAESGQANQAATRIIRITREPLDDTTVRALVRQMTQSSDGGIVTFEGVVRDAARGKRVQALEYDAYPEMAEQEMARIADEVALRWGATHIAMLHRIGRMTVGECSVVVVVACPHRAEAFDACRYAIDTLKATVPIWKKEIAEDGEEWVEG